jgi:hypothetical protein
MTGYSVSNSDLPIDEIEFIELAQVSLEAKPEELRKIAGFLMTAADNMERMGGRMIMNTCVISNLDLRSRPISLCFSHR